MTNLELQQIFESPYSYENWRKVIDFVFPEVNFLKTPIELPLDNVVRRENAESIKDFGNTVLEDGERLVLYEIKVKEKVRLDRNVKAVRKLISNEVFTGFQIGLAIFHSPDKTKWRFSLVIRELSDGYQLVDKKPTSFTYVFGRGEKGRTAADRFAGLAKKARKTLKDLEEAFSVKALSDKFFTDYKKVYQEFVNDIVSNPGSLAKFKEEAREKQARDFV